LFLCCPFFFLRNRFCKRQRNAVQHILKKAERTQKAANKPAEQGAEHHNDSRYVKAEAEFFASRHGLKSADRTSAGRSGTGITIQTRNAHLLYAAFKYIAADKAGNIRIGTECGYALLLWLKR